MAETLTHGIPAAVLDRGDREQQLVDGWRLAQLEAAGWPRAIAFLVALDSEIDLHEACGLVANGCPPLTALEILL